MPSKPAERPAATAPPAGAARRGFDVAALVRLPRPLLYAAIPALASLVLFVELPARPVVLHVIEKLGHPGVFALIALLCVVLRIGATLDRAPLGDYALAFAVCLVLGGATELGQAYTHRHPSLHDVALDARGALCALLLIAAFDRRLWAGPRRAGLRAACGVLGLALGLVIAAPLLYAGAAYANRARNYPLLFTPRSALDLYFLEAGSAPFELVPRAGGAGATLRVPLAARPYDGVELAEPSPDWRGRAALLVDVTNPGPQALDLAVRIDESARSAGYADRYNGEFRIAAGATEVVAIPLEAIAAAPRGRRLDLGHVARIVLFRVGEGGPAEFRLNAVTLR